MIPNAVFGPMPDIVISNSKKFNSSILLNPYKSREFSLTAK
jgi:hypothetical protein